MVDALLLYDFFNLIKGIDYERAERKKNADRNP